LENKKNGLCLLQIIMECKTIKYFSENGKPNFVWKVAHLKLEIAEKEAVRINNKKGNYIKRVAYKCSKCGKYHVGTSFEMIENKNPITHGWHGKSMKVVGKIELQEPIKKNKTSFRKDVFEKRCRSKRNNKKTYRRRNSRNFLG